MHEDLEELFAFTNLVESLDLRPILAHLLYHCCSSKVLRSLDGGESSTDAVKCLTPTNLCRCLQALPKLTSAEVTIRLRALTKPAPSCNTPKMCRDGRSDLVAACLKEDYETRLSDPLYPCFDDDESIPDSICVSCVKHLTREADAGRQAFLDNLVAVFNL